MSDTEVGKILEKPEGRDAIHIAVVDVVAASRLKPGAHVGVLNGEASDALANKVGIVDPFLTEHVKAGQRFYIFLYPRTITSLKHNWSHPDFPDVETANAPQGPITAAGLASEEWLRHFLDCQGHSYRAVMEAIRNGTYDDGEYDSIRLSSDSLHFSGSDASGYIPPEFWVHVANVLGHRSQHEPQYFSCSC